MVAVLVLSAFFRRRDGCDDRMKRGAASTQTGVVLLPGGLPSLVGAKGGNMGGGGGGLYDAVVDRPLVQGGKERQALLIQLLVPVVC